MDLNRFLSGVAAQRVREHQGQRLPYKQLVLLYALGKLAAGVSETKYADAEQDLKRLMNRYAKAGSGQHPEQPVWRLQNNPGTAANIWSVRSSDPTEPIGEGSGGNPLVPDLRARGLFGLSPEAVEMFESNPPLIGMAAAIIADSIVTETIRDDLLRDVNLSNQPGATPEDQDLQIAMQLAQHPHIVVRRRKRDPSFARLVKDAYDESCAVCGVRPRLAGESFGLEAAHIRWIQYDGPNDVQNGICLCRMHHVAFDRGAFTISERMSIQVSEALDRSSETTQLLGRFEGAELRSPKQALSRPAADACEWHRREVFTRLAG